MSKRPYGDSVNVNRKRQKSTTLQQARSRATEPVDYRVGLLFSLGAVMDRRPREGLLLQLPVPGFVLGGEPQDVPRGASPMGGAWAGHVLANRN